MDHVVIKRTLDIIYKVSQNSFLFDRKVYPLVNLSFFFFFFCNFFFTNISVLSQLKIPHSIFLSLAISTQVIWMG